MTRRLKSGFWAAIGFILSPLSWWNDLFVNIPLAYIFSWPIARINPEFYLPTFILGYWLTNILGLVLLHRGVEGMVKSGPPKTFVQDLIISVIYSALIALIAWLGWLPSPVDLLK